MGLDTVCFFTDDFQVDLLKNKGSLYQLQLMPNSVQPLMSDRLADFQVDLLTDVNNIQVKGRMLRGKEPLKATGIVQISAFGNSDGEIKPLLKFSCSVPKYVNGTNFYTSNKSEYNHFLGVCEKDLADVGIYADIRHSRVCRLDFTKNIETSEPYCQYLPVLNRVESGRYRSREYGKTTFLCGNHSRQVCCYDKLDCMRDLGETIPEQIIGKNIFRCENRFLKKEILRGYGLDTADKVLVCYDDLKEIFRENTKRILFDNLPEIEKVDCMDFDTNFYRCLATGSSFDEFVEDCLLSTSGVCIEHIWQNLGHYLELEADYNKTVRGLGKDFVKTTKCRHKKSWQQKIMRMLGKINQNAKKATLEQLYNELYEKLLG